MGESERAVVHMEGVHFAYNRMAEMPSPTAGAWALLDISLQLLPGTWLAVAGANGSGKSTLARLIAGLHPPDRGKVQVCGVSTTASEFHPAQIGVGYLAQQPEEYVVGLTVWDDVAFGPLNLGLPADEVERRVKEALAAVGMSHVPVDKPTLHLSGGELQRVALAGVLALRPSVLILDEPTVACHPSLRRTIREAIRGYVKRSNAAVLWVTHDPEEIAAADSVIVLDAGKIVFRGTPDMLAQAQVAGRYWGIAPLVDRAWNRSERGNGAARKALCRHSGPALQMQGVGFSYAPSEGRILDDVNLRVCRGEKVALIGASGAGKSTLMQLAAMLEARHEGSLAVLGKPITSAASRRDLRQRRAIVERLRPRVAVAFQQPEQQLFGVTVRDDFEFGLRHLGINPEEWQERIRSAIAWVGLPQAVLDRSPFELSGGERRRIAIALALAQRPELLLLDEPTAGLDHPAAVSLLNAVEELHVQRGVSVLVATHDPFVVERWPDRVVRLEKGRIVEAVGWELDDAPNTTSSHAGNGLKAAAPSGVGRGQNTPWLKDVDPRIRLIGAAIVATGVATVRTGVALALAACMVACWYFLADYPLRSVASVVRGLWPFLLAAVVFAGLRVDDGQLAVSVAGLGDGVEAALRILLLVLSVSWLTHVGGIGETLWALGALFAPLHRIGIPVSTVTGAAVIGIRMMPLLGEEARRIRRAQIARGANRIKGLRGHWLRVASLAIPLSASLFRRAERLGEALHLRGFHDGSRLVTGEAPRGGYKNIVYLLLASLGALAMVMAN